MIFKNKTTQVVPWRFEYKYRMDIWKYHQVKNNLVPFMEMDDYTRRTGNHRYLVRSLYYDNDQFQAYYEKIEGNFGRIKCRIRTYSDRLDSSSILKVELKNRWGESIEKYSTLISEEAYHYFRDNRHWPGQENPVLQEFERIYYLRAMRPKVLVQYYREGYKTRNHDDVRVTIDHDVRSCMADNLFPAPAIFKAHHPHSLVLEIKCRRKQPTWLSQLVRRHGLKYIANSKYTQGIEAVRPDLISPY